MEVFELISAVVHYFAGGVESNAASTIGFTIFQERRHIGYRFRLPCVKRLRHRSYRKRFSDATNYRMASMIIKYRKRILIILVSIRLHRI